MLFEDKINLAKLSKIASLSNPGSDFVGINNLIGENVMKRFYSFNADKNNSEERHNCLYRVHRIIVF